MENKKRLMIRKPSANLRKPKPSTNLKALIGESPNLPLEIIEDILVRLPVKSLLRFNCVSKSWCSLISSPKFTKTHISNSILDPNFSNLKLMIGSYLPRSELFSTNHCSVSSIFSELQPDAVAIDHHQSRKRFRVVGFCNGLICISMYDENCESDIFLWNPSLRRLKKLPRVGVAADDFSYYTYGFGYDESNDDYKVVWVFWDSYDGVFESVVMIYSSKNDSWNRIGDFNGRGHPSNDNGIYANGKLHFSASLVHNNAHIGWNIVSLDLETEVYGTIELPDYEDCCNLSMGVLEGCVSVLYSYTRNKVFDRADVWVLKEYGVKETWTKVVSIPYADGPLKRFFYGSPLFILSNGKVLLVHVSHLVVYNPEDNSFIYPRIDGQSRITEVGIYFESLVPLPK